MSKSDRPIVAVADDATPPIPPVFTRAVESLYEARLRPEITMSAIRPPQKVAIFSHAVGLEVNRFPNKNPHELSLDYESDAFGRFIILYNPENDQPWDSHFRLVAYIQADIDDSLALDPVLPDVAWDWLEERLSTNDYEDLGGTVTCTNSIRFGNLSGAPRTYQLELRASWTAQTTDLSSHLDAFAQALANIAGLPAPGTANLDDHRRRRQ